MTCKCGEWLMPKPRLYRDKGLWTCWGGIFARSSTTPEAAYQWWRLTYEMARKVHGWVHG